MVTARLRALVAVVAMALMAASCGGAGTTADTGADVTTTTQPSTTQPSTTRPVPDTTTTAPPTTLPEPTTAPPTTVSVFIPACSATGMNQPGPSDVPDAVAETRDLIAAYAVNCDFEGLGALASSQFTYSFGGGNDPAGYWRNAEERGDPVLATMVTVLGMSHGTLEFPDDDGEGPLYFWPAAFGAEATDEDWKEVSVLYSAEEIASMKEFGGYIGYRVGITANGDWMFFVAGD